MPNTNYLVCKLIPWTDIRITLPDGRRENLEQPEDEPIIGFMPVYEDLEAAVHAGDGFAIRPIQVVRRFKTNKEEPHDDDTAES